MGSVRLSGKTLTILWVLSRHRVELPASILFIRPHPRDTARRTHVLPLPIPPRGNSVTTLTIPSVGQNSQVAVHPPDGTRPLGILIVDDEDPVRRILGLGLQAQGFAVWLAPDTSTAVELYLGHHDEIDVVLLDVRMPDRDGPETLAALREIDPNITCCFMSGDTGDYTQEDLLDFGVVAVFQKPFRLRELARQLTEIASPNDRPVAFQ